MDRRWLTVGCDMNGWMVKIYRGAYPNEYMPTDSSLERIRQLIGPADVELLDRNGWTVWAPTETVYPEPESEYAAWRYKEEYWHDYFGSKP